MARDRCQYCLSHYCFPSHVYVFSGRSDGAVKVGYAVKPTHRIGKVRRQLTEPNLFVAFSIDTGCSFRSMRVEGAAHLALKDCWTGRGEWFACSVERAQRAVEDAFEASKSWRLA